MKKIWLVICLLVFLSVITACTNNPPDLYMTPAFGDGTYSDNQKPVIILNNEMSEASEESRGSETESPTGYQELDEEMYVVDGVNVRKANSIDSAVLFSLEKGTKVRVDRKYNNGWYRIEDQSGGAYINEEFLSKTDPDKQLLAELEESTAKKESTVAQPVTEVVTTAARPEMSTEMITEAAAETEVTTAAQTEPETTKPTLQMANTTTMTGVVTEVGTYGFSVKGKDKSTYRFACSPGVTGSMQEGGYVVVTYKTYLDSGETELISVSGQ